MRQYLYINQLAELTPWSEQAIRTMMSRGSLVEGIHYFKPNGPGSRPIFSWRAVVQYIEGGRVAADDAGATIKLADGTVIDLDEATKQAARLLR